MKRVKAIKMTASEHTRRRGQGWARSGKNRSPEYRSCVHAEARCINPKDAAYERYGGRGIKFLFTSFEQFYAELGPRPVGTSLDRIDNNGHYAPGNVRWATRSEQMKNRRMTPLMLAHLRRNARLGAEARWGKKRTK
jgi:hypothetical protein